MLIAHRSRPRVGEQANGDTVVIRETDGWTLLAVVDALGHGPEAEKVAAMAAETLLLLDPGTGARVAVEAMHAALRHSRGAAAMIAVVRRQQLEGCGVGNVLLRVQGTRIPVTLSPGVLGTRVRRIHPFVGPLPPGSRVVMVSDGISQRFRFAQHRAVVPEALCQMLMNSYGKAHDDATVLVADVEDDGARR